MSSCEIQTAARNQRRVPIPTRPNALQLVFVVQRVELLPREPDFEVAEVVHFPDLQIIVERVHHLRKERHANLARVFVLPLTHPANPNQKIHAEELAFAARVVERADRRFVRHAALQSRDLRTATRINQPFVR